VKGAAALLVVCAVAAGCGSGRYDRQARAMTGGDPARGKTALQAYGCDTCHTIPGIATADATVGPPLMQIARRTYLAGRIENTPENMTHWIRRPREIDPQTAMPDTGVSTNDARDIAAYRIARWNHCSGHTIKISNTLNRCSACGLAVVVVARSSGARAFAPEQPIAFSHVVHASDERLDCELCHSTARRAPFAGIAPVERCMGCHRFVIPDNPEVLKLRRYAEAAQPVPWVKVYVLPRFVHFTHEAHLRAHVDCATCHGAVERMPRVARVTELTMGWCVDCHRARGATDDCLACHY